MNDTPPPSIGKHVVLLWMAYLLFAFAGGFFHVSDVDVGFHMRTGAHLLEHHEIPATNTFSSTTPEHPWLLHQWWPATLFYAIYAAGGVSALIIFKASLGALLMGVVLAAARQQTARESLWPFWAATLGVIVARVRFFERPDLFSATLFAVLWFLDQRYARSRRWQWLGLPLLMAFWANTHIGVIYGFVLLAVFSGSEWLIELTPKSWWPRGDEGQSTRTAVEWRELMVRSVGLLLSLAAAVVALQLINPHGWRVLMFPVDQFLSPFWRAIIAEYRSPAWSGSEWFYVGLGALIVLQAVTWRQLNLKLLLASLAFGYLACSAQRSITYFCVVAVPHAAYMLERLPRQWPTLSFQLRRALLPTAWLAAGLLVFLPNKTFLSGAGFYPAFYPREIFQFLAAEVPPQNLFNDMRYGGSLLWWLYPRFKPFIDGRGDAYSEAFWKKEYFPVLRAADGWRDTLAKYQVHGVLVPVSDQREIPPLARVLFTEPDWALVAYNDSALLFLERTGANASVIAANEHRLVWPGDWSLSRITPGNMSAAAQEVARVLKRSPESLFAQTAAARLCLVGGKFAEAADLYAGLVQSPGAGANYWRDFGYALFRAGRFAEAESVFQLMISKRMMGGYPWYMKHFLALQRGELPEVRRCLAEALALEPRNEDYLAARTQLSAAIGGK